MDSDVQLEKEARSSPDFEPEWHMPRAGYSGWRSVPGRANSRAPHPCIAERTTLVPNPVCCRATTTTIVVPTSDAIASTSSAADGLRRIGRCIPVWARTSQTCNRCSTSRSDAEAWHCQCPPSGRAPRALVTENSRHPRRHGSLPSAGPPSPQASPLSPSRFAEPGPSRADASRDPTLRGNSVGTPSIAGDLNEGREPSMQRGTPHPPSLRRRGGGSYNSGLLPRTAPQTEWITSSSWSTLYR